jgi:hypothetical protein
MALIALPLVALGIHVKPIAAYDARGVSSLRTVNTFVGHAAPLIRGGSMHLAPTISTSYRMCLMHPVLAANAPLAYDPDSLERYYVAVGVPAGHFLGRGLAGLNDGAGVTEEAPLEDEHLRRMFHECADPLTCQQLAAKKVRANGVGSFDLTFSPSKSVSVAWAPGDPTTREIIYRCHQEAIKYVLDYVEREVLWVRAGANGGVVDETKGAVAVAFSHFDSLDGDPQLHDHVVVLNRAQSARDGVWRTLDSRSIFSSTVELSELHQGVLSDLLTRELGWDFDARTGATAAHPSGRSPAFRKTSWPSSRGAASTSPSLRTDLSRSSRGRHTALRAPWK